MNHSPLEDKLPSDPTPKDFRVLLVYPNHMFVNMLPLNIGILTACLRQNGFNVELFDTTFYKTADKPLDEFRVETLQVRKFDLSSVGIHAKPNFYVDDFKAKVESFDPHLIAITCVEETFAQAVNMLESVKERRIPVIIGGVFSTMVPDLVLSHQLVDMICVGEGELALTELCYKMWRGEDYSSVRNLWIKKDGDIVRNPMRPPIPLDEVPLCDWTLFEKERFYRPMQGRVLRMVPIEFDRGCPYRCRFCCSPSLTNIYKEQTSSNYFRRKSFDRIRLEFDTFIEKYGAEYLYFNSETFLAMSDDMFDEFIGIYEKIRLPFWMQTRVETITEAKMARLKEVGCDRVSIGIEHGNEEFRKRILQKRFSNSEVVEKLDIFRRVKIPITINNIIGFPGETRELIFDTIELNRQIPSDSVNCYYFAPFRGTALFEEAFEKGYINEGYSRTKGLMVEPTLDLPTISKEELRGLVRVFSLYVKFPKEEWPRIERAEKFDEEGDRIFGELSAEYYEKYFGKKS